MSRKIGSLNGFLSYPWNLQRHKSFISISEITFSPLPSFRSNSPHTESDDSTQTVFNTVSIYNNSDIETPDDFIDSEPSPTIFSQTPFQPITPFIPDEPYLSPFSHTDSTPILSPLPGNEPDAPSPIADDQFEHD